MNVFTPVCHSVHRQHAWQGCVGGRGHALQVGVHGRGGMHAWGHAWQGTCSAWEACMQERLPLKWAVLIQL